MKRPQSVKPNSGDDRHSPRAAGLDVDGPRFSPAVLDVLQGPAENGLLIHSLDSRGIAAGFRTGDLIVGFGGRPTPDMGTFDAQFRALFKSKGQVETEVVRAGRRESLRSERVVPVMAGKIPVRKGKPVPLDRKGTASIDTRRLPVDLWCERWSNAFGASPGKRSRKGCEHHRIALSGRTIVVESAARFDEFGAVAWHAGSESWLAAGSSLSARATAWTDGVNAASVAGREQAGLWVFADGENAIRFPMPPDGVPSLLARFLPLLLTREEGVTFPYAPIPEDASPWRRPTGQSAFPFEPAPGPRAIVCLGKRTLRAGRTATEAWCFEDRFLGEIHSRTWVGLDGAFLAYERLSTALVPGEEEEVRKALKS